MTTADPTADSIEADDAIPNDTDAAAVIAEAQPVAARTQTIPGAYPQRDPIVWDVEPHLIDRRLLAIGRVRDGAQINDVLGGDNVAFSVYQDESEEEPEGATVLYIVPMRSDGKMWPSETDSVASVIIASRYELSGERFMLYADTASLLPNKLRHRLRIWGTTPEGVQALLAEQEIGGYLHSRFPRFSLVDFLVRIILTIWGMISTLIPMLMWAFVSTIALGLLGILLLGFILLTRPAMFGAACTGLSFLNWLPWL